ncbi:hypothetical protein VNI00_016476 [Paramarasmius palmivorus]|uniref:Uncharacterized protein n=1 Tax=Paramarasmius palmivorus TaxID=297713 RepID=A0AAW0BF59_9AGAR
MNNKTQALSVIKHYPSEWQDIHEFPWVSSALSTNCREDLLANIPEQIRSLPSQLLAHANEWMEEEFRHNRGKTPSLAEVLRRDTVWQPRGNTKTMHHAMMYILIDKVVGLYNPTVSQSGDTVVAREAWQVSDSTLSNLSGFKSLRNMEEIFNQRQAELAVSLSQSLNPTPFHIAGAYPRGSVAELLVDVSSRRGKVKLQQCLMNLQLTALFIRVLTKGAGDLPESKEDMLKLMKNKNEVSTKLQPLPQPLQAALESYKPRKWRGTLYAALTISPLILIAGASLYTRDLPRSAMVQLWFALGTDRPPQLATLEQALWKGIMSIALDSKPAEVALQEFLGLYRQEKDPTNFLLDISDFFQDNPSRAFIRETTPVRENGTRNLLHYVTQKPPPAASRIDDIVPDHEEVSITEEAKKTLEMTERSHESSPEQITAPQDPDKSMAFEAEVISGAPDGLAPPIEESHEEETSFRTPTSCEDAHTDYTDKQFSELATDTTSTAVSPCGSVEARSPEHETGTNGAAGLVLSPNGDTDTAIQSPVDATEKDCSPDTPMEMDSDTEKSATGASGVTPSNDIDEGDARTMSTEPDTEMSSPVLEMDKEPPEESEATTTQELTEMTTVQEFTEQPQDSPSQCGENGSRVYDEAPMQVILDVPKPVEEVTVEKEPAEDSEGTTTQEHTENTTPELIAEQPQDHPSQCAENTGRGADEVPVQVDREIPITVDEVIERRSERQKELKDALERKAQEEQAAKRVEAEMKDGKGTVVTNQDKKVDKDKGKPSKDNSKKKKPEPKKPAKKPKKTTEAEVVEEEPEDIIVPVEPSPEGDEGGLALKLAPASSSYPATGLAPLEETCTRTVLLGPVYRISSRDPQIFTRQREHCDRDFSRRVFTYQPERYDAEDLNDMAFLFGNMVADSSKYVHELDWEDYQELSSAKRQKLLGEKPLVLYDTPHLGESRELKDIVRSLGSLDIKRTVHDLSRRGLSDDVRDVHRESTLRRVVREAGMEKPRPLNMIDIPGTGGLSWGFSSDDIAFRHCDDLRGDPNMVPHLPLVVQEISWHLLGLKHAFHRAHVDTCGFGTIISVATGRKLIFILSPPNTEDWTDAARLEFYRNLDMNSENSVGWHIVGIVLCPGQAMHNFTNTTHLVHRIMLARMVKFWHDVIVRNSSTYTEDCMEASSGRIADIPNLFTFTGVMDLLSVLVIIELGSTLWKESYEKGCTVASEHLQAYAAALVMGDEIVSWIRRNVVVYEFTFEGTDMPPEVHRTVSVDDIRTSLVVQQACTLLKQADECKKPARTIVSAAVRKQLRQSNNQAWRALPKAEKCTAKGAVKVADRFDYCADHAETFDWAYECQESGPWFTVGPVCSHAKDFNVVDDAYLGLISAKWHRRPSTTIVQVSSEHPKELEDRVDASTSGKASHEDEECDSDLEEEEEEEEGASSRVQTRDLVVEYRWRSPAVSTDSNSPLPVVRKHRLGIDSDEEIDQIMPVRQVKKRKT